MPSETIAAIATPPGRGGVGIVRVSGPQAESIALAVTGRRPEPRVARLAAFAGADGQTIDQGLALFFAGPRSFTGEDVLELQGHGGPVVLDMLLGRCLQMGARLARPGEFTERAFLNGKLDLAQAEAVADLIESSTAAGARLAARSLEGAFSARIHGLVERLTGLRAYVEATLDFPDEEIPPLAETEVVSDVTALAADTRTLLTEAERGQMIREGLAVVILGAPNVGKSSLINALSGEETAIVTPIPGTTRDLLKVDIQIDGLPIRIVDTAGLRDAQDPIEHEGIRRARDAGAKADLVLWVYDASIGLGPEPLDSQPSGGSLIRIRNKIDLLDESPRVTVTSTLTEVALSVQSGAGLSLLRDHLKAWAGLGADSGGAFSARRRHVDALQRGLKHVEAALDGLRSRFAAELVAEELQAAQAAFGEITGRVAPDDLLEQVFSTFCIGK
jgi:tRNA modification GTPase